jgi:hypothetical protein
MKVKLEVGQVWTYVGEVGEGGTYEITHIDEHEALHVGGCFCNDLDENGYSDMKGWRLENPTATGCKQDCCKDK